MPERQSAMCRARLSGIGESERRKLVGENVADRWKAAPARRARGCRRSPRRDRRAAEACSISSSPFAARAASRHCRARQADCGKQMGLRVVDHLHPMLDGPQQPIGVGELAARRRLVEPAGRSQSRDRVERRRRPHRRIAAAVDHLLDLDEEFDLANAAAAALEIVARPDARPLRKMVADARGDLPNFFDHTEIERAAPDERLDRVEEALPERDVAGSRAGADEGRPLPRQRARFVMRDRGIDGQRDRRDFRRRPQPAGRRVRHSRPRCASAGAR